MSDPGELRPTVATRRQTSARPRRAIETPEPLAEPDLHAIERHLAALAVHAGAHVRDDPEAGLTLVENVPPGIGYDHGAIVRWDAATWSEQLAAFERRQRDRGVVPSLVVADGVDTPPDLAERLADRGWIRVATETILWTRRPATVPHLDPTLRVEAVTPRTAGQHEQVERAIFGLAPTGAEVRVAGMRAGLADGTLRAYLVRLRGEPVAVARLSLTDRVAGLAGVGVVADQRRRGLGSLITAIATRAGLAGGRSPVWLSVDAADVGARIMYEGLGFRPAFDWSRYLGPPS